jgi:hypothetical protein
MLSQLSYSPGAAVPAEWRMEELRIEKDELAAFSILNSQFSIHE